MVVGTQATSGTTERPPFRNQGFSQGERREERIENNCEMPP
jgi:hypothetical protein